MLACGLLLLPSTCLAVEPPSLMERFSQVSRGAHYEPPSMEAFEQARKTFLEMFVNQHIPCDKLKSLGFRIVRMPLKNESWVIIEDALHRGAGLYAVRSEPKQGVPLLLQAPHSFFDRYTRELAVQWMQEGGVTAVAWNTTHRYQLDDGRSDVAHQDISFFQAFMLAFAEAYPSGGIIQLHGFSSEKRRDSDAASADVILSNGTLHASVIIKRIDDCLDDLLVGASRVFPDEVGELGATSNRNARALRAIGFEGFVHVEMSQALRKKLSDVWFLRNRFVRCIEGGWR